MADSYIMAIDEGTTSTRAVILDHAGKMVGEAQRSLPSIFLNRAGWSTMRMRFGKRCCRRLRIPLFRLGCSRGKLQDSGLRISVKQR